MREQRTRETLAVALAAASGPRALALRLVTFLVLLAAAQTHDGSIHAGSHWFVLAGYAVSSVWLALTAPRRDGERLAWLSTLLDAGLAVYVVIEHMVAGSDGPGDPADTVSRLPAFLLLLQTGLTLRVWHTVVFALVVSSAWASVLIVGLARPDLAVFGPAVRGPRLAHAVHGLLDGRHWLSRLAARTRPASASATAG